MRKLLLLLALLCLPQAMPAQQATTTVQFTAAMGGGYSGGPVFLHQITFAGTGTPGYSTFFDAGGNLNITVPGGTYQFTFCNTAGVCFGASAAPQTNTFSLTAIFNTSAASSGVVSSVFGRIGAVVAQTGDYNANQLTAGALPNGTTATTQALSDNSLDVATDAFVIANAGTNNLANPPSPIMGFYLSNACPLANTSNCFNTPANTQQDVTASWGTGSNVITITDGKFTANDVGKRAYGYVTCNAFQNTLASNAASGAITTSTVVTITGFTDANHVTISQNPANAVNQLTNFGGCFIWGNPDDAGMAALNTAVQAAPSCPKIFLAAGYYMITKVPGIMNLPNPPACAQSTSTFGGSAGNIYYSAGLEIEGRGRANTIIYVTPGFPETGTCTNGLTANACLVRTLEGRWSDFSISGGQNSTANGLSADLIEIDGPGSLDYFNCYNWGGSANSVTGIYIYQGWDQWHQVDNSGCGGIGVWVAANGPGTFPFFYQLRVENSSDVDLRQTGTASFVCYTCGLYTSQFNGNANPETALFQDVGTTGSAVFFQPDIQDGGSSTTNKRIGINSNGYVRIFGGDVAFGGPSGSTTNVAISASATSTTVLEDVFLNAGSTGNTYKDAAGAVLFDRGGNSGYANGGGVSISGAFISSSQTWNGTVLTAGKVVLSAGWGSTATVTGVGGGNTPSFFTITNSGTGQAASPTITLTFPTPYFYGPLSCQATQIGGTNTVGTFTTSGLTPTQATFTFSLTPTASSTERVQVTCVNP